jgi:hypothetical protein
MKVIDMKSESVREAVLLGKSAADLYGSSSAVDYDPKKQ